MPCLVCSEHLSPVSGQGGRGVLSAQQRTLLLPLSKGLNVGHFAPDKVPKHTHMRK